MKINQCRPFIGEEEYASMKDCFDRNWITEGPKSEELSKKLLDLIGCKYGVFANNGTLSLYMSLKALGIGQGDEVLVPNFTFIASMNAVIMAGAKPVLVDIEKDSLHIDVSKCEEALTSRTKAIMPVHIYGTAVNMDELMSFATSNSLKVIEDAAQAIGVYWKERHCGSFGDCGSFSFFADKTITMGEGGFVCTNDEEVYNKLLTLRNQGRVDRGSFIHPHIGYNFRITDLQASIGLTQLGKLEFIVKDKSRIIQRYSDNLDGISGLTIFKPQKGSNHVPFRVALMLEESTKGLDSFLKVNQIETREFFYPLHKQPCISCLGLCDDNFPNSILVHDRGLCMPSYIGLEDDKIDYICNHIKVYLTTTPWDLQTR